MEMMTEDDFVMRRLQAAAGDVASQQKVDDEHEALRARVAELEANIETWRCTYKLVEGDRDKWAHEARAREQRAATLQAEVEQWKASSGSYFDALRESVDRERALKAEVERLKAETDLWRAENAMYIKLERDAREALAGAMSTITGLQEQVQSAGIALAESERKRSELAFRLEQEFRRNAASTGMVE